MRGAFAVAFVLCLSAAGCASAPPRPRSVENEQLATRQIVRLLSREVLTAYRAGERPAQRDAHAHAQGCVKAHFDVLATAPKALRIGVFSYAHAYTAWIRFSNASGSDDQHAFAHGMAIKLTGVPGRKILPAEADETTQDFLLVNYPVFNIPAASEYVDFLTKSQNGQLPAFYREYPNAARLNEAISSQRVSSPLLQRYYSMTPYALGSNVVKYSAQPVSCTTGAALHDDGVGPLPTNPHYLRKAMIASLAHAPSCFLFMVQRRTDPNTMPIEDATVLWDERRAPFVTVALVEIPAQRFDSTQQDTFCENLSYTPWHALPEQRPLGFVNRIRRVVYDAISSLRHRLNGAPRREPTGNEHFPGSPTW